LQFSASNSSDHNQSGMNLFIGGNMAQYGTLQNFKLQNAAEDIRGSHMYGVNDEKLGKITDVVFSNGSGDILYVVVDTGGWLSTKEFIVPAGRVRVSAKHENDYEVPLTKSQIENFPPYNPKNLESDKTWDDYETRYRSKWDDGPVMHREADTGRIVQAGADDVVIANSASGIGGRWDTFQSRLRERRKQSAFGGATTAGGESVEDLRKAV
jgi:sporulation protein YlmC with PRC-barrel domain